MRRRVRLRAATRPAPQGRSNPSPAARKLRPRSELFSFVFKAFRVFREARKTRKNGFDDYADDYCVIKAFDVSLHPIRTGVLHFLRNMAVNVPCEGSCGMSHVVLNGFNVVSVLQSEDGVGMSEIMDPGLRSANLCCDLFEMAVGSLGMKMKPQLVKL